MKSTIERALELTGDGRHRTIEEVRASLRKEGFDNVQGHTSGRAIQRQLRERMAAARAEGSDLP